jgi:hypothetical protein
MSDPNWLREPDPAGKAVVYLSIPEGAKLTPDVEDAINRLSAALLDLGNEKGSKFCTFLNCESLNGCMPLHSQNCFILRTCRISV